MIKHLGYSLLLRLGLHVAPAVDAREVRTVVKKFQPWSTEHDLIRLGDDDDGGYLVPDDLEGIAACFSPGVDRKATFEADLIERGIRCYLADGSVAQPPFMDPLLDFRKQFLGVTNDEGQITIDQWMADAADRTQDQDCILQMDIEGAEWKVLLNVSDAALSRFRIIVLELHSLEQLFSREGHSIVDAVIDRLLQQFTIVHLHPNNYGGVVWRGDIEVPRLLEVTLLRNDRVSRKAATQQFPHPLDIPNIQGQRDVALPRAWYSS